MLTQYVRAALESARYRILKNGRYYGEIPACRGVWAAARDLERCRWDLQEILEEWLVLKLRDGDPIPRIQGVSLRPRRKAPIG